MEPIGVEIMVKVNGKEIEWDRAPNFVNNVQRKVLWKDKQTGALFAILRIQKGEYIEQPPHSHPHANQFTLRLSRKMELPNGTQSSFKEGDYGFGYIPKNERHGAQPEGVKVLEDLIWIHYWDGSDDWDDSDARVLEEGE
jgi:hypothetical protein